jgi:CRISPR-associated protein Csm2
MTEISQAIVDRVKKFKNFHEYGIRDLVLDADKLGQDLKIGKLETNQVRKFLDAINRIKADLIDETADSQGRFQKIEVDIVLLKPKLAYAAARQKSAKPLQEVLDVAIDRVHSILDFDRLVQFVESIIAYHKAAGGK